MTGRGRPMVLDRWMRLSLGLHLGVFLLALLLGWVAQPKPLHYAPPPSQLIQANLVHLQVKPVHKKPAKVRHHARVVKAKPHVVPAKQQVAIKKAAKRVQKKPAAAKKIAQQRRHALEDELRKRLQQESAQQVAAAAVRHQQAAVVDRYRGLIVQAISQYWLVPANLSRDIACELAIDLAPDGTVLAVNLLHSSGNPVLDNSARNAVWKASPLPVPHEVALFAPFRHLQLTVKKGGING